jgi:membrane-bound lytic murein transglycosylase B
MTLRALVLATGLLGAAGLLSSSAFAQTEFAQCIDRLQVRAVESGVPRGTVERVLATVAPLERVIAADRNQPEFVDTFADYLRRRVTEGRVEAGRELYRQHRALLDELTRRHGVPGHYLLAFWALETNYGNVMGNVPVFDALATLACDRRRSEYFAVELVNALHLADRGDVDPRDMTGSWAGAMGHTQFMPSAYLEYAVDGDGDGRVDLWGSVPDALTSAAAYLSGLDWRRGARWGREVKLPDGFDYYATGRERRRGLAQWRELGITDVAGRPIPTADFDAALLLPAGRRGPAFLVYDNFDVIMSWNRSEFFALTVGHLADRIAGAGPLAATPPAHDRLTRDQLAALQTALNERGFDSGTVDGRLGPTTMQAIRDYQRSRQEPADGFPDPDILSALGID